MSDKAIDAHCHLFTLEYLLRELLAALHSAKQQTYLLEAAPEHLLAGPPTKGFFARIVQTLGSIAGFIDVLEDDCKEHWITDCKGYSDKKPDSLITMPLMMDIYYIFRHNDITDTDMNLTFEELVDKLLDEMLKVKKLSAKVKEIITKALKNVVNEILADSPPDPLAGRTLPANLTINYDGIEMSPGYLVHLKELVALRQDAPDAVLPFLAVDPRRNGIVDFVKNNVGSGRPFTGVKIYPPLGYKPDNDVLMHIYAYCKGKGIPVTAHCQLGSFCNFLSPLGEDYKKLADPMNWDPVLKEFNDLRINFAHCGGSDSVANYLANPNDTSNWTYRILSYMEKYDNVYADIAAFANETDAPNVEKLFNDTRHPDIKDRTKPKIKQRLMFGTDYVICLLPGHSNLAGKMGTYYGYYFDNLSKDTKAAMFFHNPRTFLGQGVPALV